VLKFAEALGWRVVEPNGKGYTKLLCPCGKHKKWLHKTPSNPNYFNETVRWIERTCNGESKSK